MVYSLTIYSHVKNDKQIRDYEINNLKYLFRNLLFVPLSGTFYTHFPIISL